MTVKFVQDAWTKAWMTKIFLMNIVYYGIEVMNLTKFWVVYLGDNCIQIFHLGRYIVGCTVGNLVLRWCPSGDVKCDFRTFFRQYTSRNENFKYGYPHSNALLQFRLKLERYKPHNARHLMKCDVTNDIKLFPTVYGRINCHKFYHYPIRSSVTKASALEFTLFVISFWSFWLFSISSCISPLVLFTFCRTRLVSWWRSRSDRNSFCSCIRIESCCSTCGGKKTDM